jgi:hypothetical protein
MASKDGPRICVGIDPKMVCFEILRNRDFNFQQHTFLPFSHRLPPILKPYNKQQPLASKKYILLLNN